MSEDKEVYVCLLGNTYSIKEKLKERGYVWMRPPEGLGTQWCKKMKIDDVEDEIRFLVLSGIIPNYAKPDIQAVEKKDREEIYDFGDSLSHIWMKPEQTILGEMQKRGYEPFSFLAPSSYVFSEDGKVYIDQETEEIFKSKIEKEKEAGPDIRYPEVMG